MISYLGKRYEPVRGGDCRECAHSTTGYWMSIPGYCNSTFCMEHCKIDHTQNHWEAVTLIQACIKAITRR